MNNSDDYGNDELETRTNPSELYPIFPISNAVFFPKTLIPLHIFEPRYKKLIHDIEKFGNKRFVLTGLLTSDKPIKSQPDQLGVLVEMVEQESLSDGRSNIVVLVHDRVKIGEYFRNYDIFSSDYAIAEIIVYPEEPIDSNSPEWLDLRKSLFLEFKTHFERLTNRKLDMTEDVIAQTFSPEESINTVCNITLLDYWEKQSLLSIDSLYERGKKILEIYRNFNSKISSKTDDSRFYQ